MPLSRLSRFVLAVAVTLVVAVASSAPGFAAGKKDGPPPCGAVNFRAMAPNQADGDHDAGLYKSRYGRLELKATVMGGLATNYYMVINGRKAEPLAGGASKASTSCLKSKHISVPVKAAPAGACTGMRLRVVTDRSGAKGMALLFGLQGSEWLFCQASEL
ncbi:conserved exported hypothetical protein [uncultured Gammaproteobacteria bacterium]